MKEKPKKRPAPFSIRFTEEERARLEYDAEGMAIGEYIKWRVFHDSNPKRKVRNRRPIKDHVELDVDYKIGVARTELKCASCGGHLGHAFNDGPRETTGERHCINGAAMQFIPDEN